MTRKLNQRETTNVADRRRTRKHYQKEKAKTRKTCRQHRRNKGERSRLASGRGISPPVRYGGDWLKRLSAEDDRGCSSSDGAKPQGSKGDSGPGRGAKEPIARDS